MAFKWWIDGFDYYESLLEKYDEAWGAYWNGTWYTSAPAIGDWGRLGSRGVKFSYTEEGFKKAGIFGNLQEWNVGMAIKPGAATRHYLFILEDITTVQFYVFLDASGYLHVCRGTPGQYEEILGSSVSPLATMNTWHHYEVNVTISDSAGSVKVCFDGDTTAPVIELTGVNTRSQFSSNNYANTIVIGSEKWTAAMFGQGTTRYMDDLFIMGTAGGVMQGDARVLTRYPTGAGSHTDFTPSAGANWECVDETPPNITDYVYSNTVGHIDTYDHTDLPANTETVLAVAVNHYTTKMDAGMRKIGAVLIIGGSTLVGDDVVPALGSYRHFQQTFEGPFDLADCNACEFGIKITG